VAIQQRATVGLLARCPRNAALLLPLLVFSVLCGGASDSALAKSATKISPSWFPKVSCRQAWGNRDLGRYNFSKDSKTTPAGNEGYDTYEQRLRTNGVDRKSCYKDWTILVYMAANNDLHPYALWDLDEMEGKFESGQYAGSTLKSDLVVQVHTQSVSNGGHDGLRRLHIFQREDQTYSPALSKSKFANVGPEIVRSPIVELLPQTQPSGQDLLQFLDWGIRAYPAMSYMVVVWGHGQGWSSGPDELSPTHSLNGKTLNESLKTLQQFPEPTRSAQFGGIFNNPKTGSSVSIPDLRDAIRNVVDRTLEGRRIDVYASDACLMQMAEVLAEVTPYTRYVVGSAQVQTYLGLPYRRLLYEINSGRFLSTAALTGKEDEARLVAMMLPKLAEASLDPLRGQQGRADKQARATFTMSSIASQAFEQRLLPSMEQFTQAAVSYLSEDPVRAFQFDSLIRSTPSFMGGGRELGSFLKLIDLARIEDLQRASRTPGSELLARKTAELERALDETVIERRLGTGYTVAGKSYHLLGFRGFGIWIPSGPIEFQHRTIDFQQSRLHQQTGWQNWLKSAFGISE
jgi:hypothetical protein